MMAESVERLYRVGDMRGRMRTAESIDPGPHTESVHSVEWIGSFAGMLPDCAEILQHPLLILQSLRRLRNGAVSGPLATGVDARSYEHGGTAWCLSHGYEDQCGECEFHLSSL